MKRIILFLSVYGVCGILGMTLFLPRAAAQLSWKEKAKEHYRLGEIYYQHGLKEEASREFQKALELMSAPAAPVPGKLSQKKPAPEDSLKKEAPEPSQQREYTISTGDVLHISVWENPDLTQEELVVRPDGKISFPLIDEVQAAGRTIPELDEVITEKLKEFIRYPDISISLRAMGGEKIIVLGQVERPGIYTLGERRTALEGIALAGGFTDDAVLNSVIVIKGGFSNPNAKRVNLVRAIEKGDVSQDVPLTSQDIIYVPKKFIANLNYFMDKLLGPLSKGAITYKTFTTLNE